MHTSRTSHVVVVSCVCSVPGALHVLVCIRVVEISLTASLEALLLPVRGLDRHGMFTPTLRYSLAKDSQLHRAACQTRLRWASHVAVSTGKDMGRDSHVTCAHVT